MTKLECLIKKLENIEKLDDRITLTTYLIMSKAFELNLFFKGEEDKVMYIREQLIHKRFLPYYPSSLTVKKWKIMEYEYEPNQLFISFEIGRDDYIKSICQKLEDAIF